MPDDARRAQGAARIARGRLHPDLAEGAFTNQAAVGDAVERNATRQAQVFLAGLPVQGVREPEDHVLRHFLDRRRDIHLPLGHGALGGAGGPPNRVAKRSLVMVRPVQ